jgi:hypothetical protein
MDSHLARGHVSIDAVDIYYNLAKERRLGCRVAGSARPSKAPTIFMIQVIQENTEHIVVEATKTHQEDSEYEWRSNGDGRTKGLGL